MKTKTLSLTAILLTTLFLTISCDNKEIPPEEKFPRDTPFTEFSLEGTSCEWVRFQGSWGTIPPEIIIINNSEELKTHILCTEEKHSEIDFSKHTLLLARGVWPTLPIIYNTDLQQISAQNYVMTVGIYSSMLPAHGHWQVPIVVDKLDKEIAVELIITQQN